MAVPIAVDDGPYTVTPGEQFSLSAPGILANDTYLNTYSSVGEFAAEGMNALLDAYLNNSTDVTGFEMILFTNTNSVDGNSTPDEFIRPVGGGYTDVALTRSSFSVTDGVVSYPRVQFSNTGSDYTLDVTGWALITVETTPRQVCSCFSGATIPVTAAGNPYAVDMKITLETGAEGAGITLNPALNIIAERFFKGVNADLGTSKTLQVIDDVGDEITSDGGYSSKTLLDGSWVISLGKATYAIQSWTASGAAFNPAVAGANIVSTGTTPTLLHSDSMESPIVIIDGNTFEYDLTTGA